MESDKGLPLGLFAKDSFEEQTIHLESCDLIFFYTDGLIDAMNSKDNLLGLEPVIGLLRESANKTPKDLLQAMLQLVEGHRSGEQMDDLTMLAIRQN